MKLPSIQELIQLYDLKPHPEGGYFKETYRSIGKIPGDTRNYSTAIFYLLTQGAKSNFHRITSDEVWHFYLGGPMTLVQLVGGQAVEVVLGQDVRGGQKLQYTVLAGVWFGGYPNPGTEYSLVGCTVAPGFEFKDFELGRRNQLLREFPNAAELVRRLTAE